jgi:hypothetical protein
MNKTAAALSKSKINRCVIISLRAKKVAQESRLPLRAIVKSFAEEFGPQASMVTLPKLAAARRSARERGRKLAA